MKQGRREGEEGKERGRGGEREERKEGGKGEEGRKEEGSTKCVASFFGT